MDNAILKIRLNKNNKWLHPENKNDKKILNKPIKEALEM